MIFRKSRNTKVAPSTWLQASAELGLEIVANASELGAVAHGHVNDHPVFIAPTRNKSNEQTVDTRYSVKYEAPEAPSFRLTKRTEVDDPTVDTGHSNFDAFVTVETDDPEMFRVFLTGPRRAVILRLLTHWPAAKITNGEARLITTGIEQDHDRLVDSICELVAAAETFDRPTSPDVAPAGSVGSQTHEDGDSDQGDTQSNETATGKDDRRGDPSGAGESGVLIEVRLDEVSVLNDLFASGLERADISARFEKIYQGQIVTWSGEVLRAGPADDAGSQRIAVLIGSADGQDPSSGRVVALTSFTAVPVLCDGDVVTFSGELANLHSAQRLFHIT